MKTTIRTAITLGVAAAAAVALAACGSSTSSESTQAPTAAASVATAPAPVSNAEAAVTSNEPVPTTCPEFRMTAAHMATYWQYLNLALGTTNDEAQTLADMRGGITAMQDLAQKCAPKAIDSIDAFAATVEAIQPIYQTNPTGADLQNVNNALAAMRAAGAKMFTDMGQSDYSWQ